MNAKQIYGLKPIKTDKSLSVLKRGHADLLPEINNRDFNFISYHKNEKTEIRYYIDSQIKKDNDYLIFASIWHDNNPVMIIQKGCRGYHYARFITNKEKFIEMVSYLKSLIPIFDCEYIQDFIDENENIEELTSFCNHNLSEFYNIENIKEDK